jgi:enterochelin esterase-like enzyme
MERDIPVSIVLPSGYNLEAKMHYPSVYVLHGANGSGQKNASASVIRQLVDKYGFIAVCPDGGKTSWWLDSPIDPKYQYETFVVREVVPYVDANYKTVAGRSKRAIMGGSMGGHGACYLGMRHKDIFGAIGNIYGGVDLVPWSWSSGWEIDKRLGPRDANMTSWEEHSVINVAKSLKNGEVELVSVVGTEDFFLGCNRQLHELLSANGVAHTYVEMRSQTTLGSTHGKFYAQGAEVCLRFIYNYFKDGYGHLGDVDTRPASASCDGCPSPFTVGPDAFDPQGGHIQGIAASDDALYVAQMTRLVKVDWAGKVLATRSVQSHTGDITWHDGELYTSVAVYPERKAGRIQVFDKDLNLMRETAIDRTIDGITYADGVLYVGMGAMEQPSKNPHRVNIIGRFDAKTLKEIAPRAEFDYGHETKYGFQDIVFDGERLVASFYSVDGSPDVVFFDKNLNVLGTATETCNQGFDMLPRSMRRDGRRFVRATTNISKDPASVSCEFDFFDLNNETYRYVDANASQP